MMQASIHPRIELGLYEMNDVMPFPDEEAEIQFKREVESRLKSLEERLNFLEQSIEVQKREYSND